MIVDASGLIMGRLAVFAAKNALKGENVDIINCENAIVTGNKRDVIEKYKHQRGRGGPFHGPFIGRQSSRLLKHVIKGMLPNRQARGREVLARIKCHLGIPKELEGKKYETVKGASSEKLETTKYLTLKELSYELGAR
ncbi:MAG: 50S ribosomal protein L13 [Nanoarchaeota archaeon]|nr:50S ribosomal protein L13 [Nanoarchaeota archaeon]